MTEPDDEHGYSQLLGDLYRTGVFESPFQRYFRCSFGAESLCLYKNYELLGQESPYSLDCMHVVTPQSSGWKHTVMASNQEVNVFNKNRII